jgi:hypothetical protein
MTSAVSTKCETGRDRPGCSGSPCCRRVVSDDSVSSQRPLRLSRLTIPVVSPETAWQCLPTPMSLAPCQRCRGMPNGASSAKCAQLSARLHVSRMLFCSGRRMVAGAPRHRSCHGEGWEAYRLAARRKRQLRIALLRLSGQSPRSKSHPSFLISLVQPCCLERLVNVSSLAPDGLCDLSGPHSFLAQRYDACAVESDRAAFVNALRLCGGRCRHAADRG